MGMFGEPLVVTFSAISGELMKVYNKVTTQSFGEKVTEENKVACYNDVNLKEIKNKWR